MFVPKLAESLKVLYNEPLEGVEEIPNSHQTINLWVIDLHMMA